MEMYYYEFAGEGAWTLTQKFKKAVEGGVAFGTWKPNHRLPSISHRDKLIISDLVCGNLCLPLDTLCKLENCSIDNLFIADMGKLQASNTFVNNVNCVEAQIVEGLITRTIIHGSSCNIDIKKEIGTTGTSMKRVNDIYFNVSLEGGCTKTASLKKIIDEDAPFDRSNGGIGLPALPKFARSIDYLFAGCKAKTMDLSKWDVSGMSFLMGVFCGCTGLVDLNLSGWDIGNVVSVAGLFRDCSSLTSLNLSGWDVSNVEVMDLAFGYCYSLTSLDLSGWDITRANSFWSMFRGCQNLVVTVDASQLDKFNSLGNVPETVTFVTK